MDNSLAKQIGEAAKTARNRARLTQEDAAERIGISVEFYARIERGKTLPSTPTLVAMCRGLETSSDNLLGMASGNVTTSHLASPGRNDEDAGVRRLMRRLRTARPRTLRFVALLLTELERGK